MDANATIRGLNRMIDQRQEELATLNGLAQLLQAQSQKIQELMPKDDDGK